MRDRLADFRQKQEVDDDKIVIPSVVININPSRKSAKYEEEMKEYLKQAFECRTKIELIERLIKQIKELHSIIHGSAARNEDKHKQLNVFMDEVRNLFNVVKETISKMEKTYKGKITDDESSIQKLDPETRLDEVGATPVKKSHRPADIKIMANQYETLQFWFYVTWTEYNECLSVYRDKCKEKLTRQIQITEKKITPQEVNNMIESGNFTIFSYNEHFQQKDLEELETRHNDITKLAKSLKELHGMFKDLALMVEQQGEMLNNIENNIENAKEYVHEAASELSKAEGHAKSYRKKKLICAVIILVVLIVVATVIGVTVYLNTN